MLMLKALKNRAISRLWLGQVGSAIGDEIYRVAFIWLAVGLIGENTGYLAALQLVAVLVFGVFGGKWADRWSPYRTMIGVDLFRAVITLTPVFLFFIHRPSFTALVVSSVILSGLGAFFEPALQAARPIAARDAQTLKAANGLMSTTLRLARVMGPAIIGLLSVFMQTIHFFTLNALSYVFSTYCVFSIRSLIPSAAIPKPEKEAHVLTNFISSMKVLNSKPSVKRLLMTKSLMGATWGVVYGLGIALVVHDIDANNVKAFGLVMGAYGIGNIVAAIWIGNTERKNPERILYLGLIWLGAGFAMIGLVKSFPLLLLAAALTAIGGPLNDLPFTDIVQLEFHLKDLPKIFRLRMIIETLFSLILTLLSPLLFKTFSVRPVIIGCGVFVILTSGYGLIQTFRTSKLNSP
jgi:DHA3 family macrolide efflux protein-like MFS transporter